MCTVAELRVGRARTLTAVTSILPSKWEKTKSHWYAGKGLVQCVMRSKEQDHTMSARSKGESLKETTAVGAFQLSGNSAGARPRNE